MQLFTTLLTQLWCALWKKTKQKPLTLLYECTHHRNKCTPTNTQHIAVSEVEKCTYAVTNSAVSILESHGRKVYSDCRGSCKTTRKAAAPCLTVCFMGAQQSGCLLTAVPLHFYSCHWGTAAGVSAALIFHIHQGSYQTKPSKKDHREYRILI